MYLNGHDAGMSLPVGDQFLFELFWLVQQMRGCRSVLEIGSRRGHTLRFMAYACGRGAKVRSVDNGSANNLEELEGTINSMCSDGFDAKCFCADSASLEAIAWASGPYDFVFIDGDHTLDGVREDWYNYGPMGKRVGFHDIASGGVKQLWDELKANGFSTSEIIVETGYMGIGILEDPLSGWRRGGASHHRR